MRSLCRLSVVSVASLSALVLFCVPGAHAQTPAQPAPPATPAPLHNPIPFVTPVLPPLSGARSSAPQLPAPSTTLRVPPISPGTIQRLQALQALEAQKLTLLSRNEGTCYALRTYGFTAGHDPAEAPHLSSHTTCTPASQSHAKAIVVTPTGH